MTDFRALLDVFTHRATESEATLTLCDMSRGQIRSFRGELRGPRCAKAKTLSTSFALSRRECSRNVSESASILVTEPCYWSPELPMLYDLELEIELTDGTTTQWRQLLGLQRWKIHDRDFFRNGKRFVMRGAAVAECSPDAVAAADRAGLVLLLRAPSAEILERASQLGVAVVADLRGCTDELTPALLQCAWQPAVSLVLVGDELQQGFYQPHGVKLGVVNGAKPQAAEADVLWFELGSGERPPAWAVTCGGPVIASERGAAYAELSEARAACDRLQARLAPDFDLAGYFV